MSPIEVLAICLNKIKGISDKVESIPAALVYKGSVDNVDKLPTSPRIGDMYNITVKSIYGEAGMNVAWTGTEWDALGDTVDMSQYYTKEETNAKFAYKITVNDVTGTNINMELVSDTLYVFTDVLTSLTISYLRNSTAENIGVKEWMFQFTSGDTPTILTLPADIQSELIVAPNTTYQCSIINNLLTFQGWKVNN